MRSHVVTGAASGIGLEVVRRLCERGDRVIALVRAEDRVDAVTAAAPDCAAVLVLDLADLSAIGPWAADLTGGRPAVDAIDSLVHCAGVVDLAPVAELDLDTWQRHLAVNLTGPALLTSALLPALRTARGTVVLVNSGAGLRAHPTWSAYAASKFGLRAFADALRQEEGSSGVRVTSVFPGRTATPMQERVHEQEGRAYDADDWVAASTVADAILHVLDLPRDATIPELSVTPGP